jgi:hypothetical protein
VFWAELHAIGPRPFATLTHPRRNELALEFGRPSSWVTGVASITQMSPRG